MQQISQSVCKYFLQGKCKFGEKCFYQHPSDHSSTSTNNKASQNIFSVLTPQVFQKKNSPFLSHNKNTEQIQKNPSDAHLTSLTPTTLACSKESAIQSLKTDLGHYLYWPFTCYGIPGIKTNILHGDISFEEFRLESYNGAALKSFSSLCHERHGLWNQVLGNAHCNPVIEAHFNSNASHSFISSSELSGKNLATPFLSHKLPSNTSQPSNPFVLASTVPSGPPSPMSSCDSSGSSYFLSGTLKELTFEEKNAYLAESFRLGQVPSIPPPSSSIT